MNRLIFHHDDTLLPPASETILPVQLYGITGKERGDISTIGNPVIDKIKRLGVPISEQAMDFLSIALAVTAADTFVQRESSPDGWTRQFSIQLPLYQPERWLYIKDKLQKALHFLSGDIWNFEFIDGGFPPPEPYGNRYRLLDLQGINSVCLFSGGLDSAIGAINLLSEDHSILLVSHAYPKDAQKQTEVSRPLLGRFSRFALNADPSSITGHTDVSMRTRSINFLSFGAVGASAVQMISQQDRVPLFVPENGFISLNAPLTPRRIGSLSTRTTHPYFIKNIQEIFDYVGIPCIIQNPYQFKTKGEMISECLDDELLLQIIHNTVSCSHWKRPNKQCGVCVPCLIRRSAINTGMIEDQTEYLFDNLTDVLNMPERRDDLLSVSIAIEQKKHKKIGHWILDSGPLPPSDYQKFKNVFLRGLNEVEAYLKGRVSL